MRAEVALWESTKDIRTGPAPRRTGCLLRPLCLCASVVSLDLFLRAQHEIAEVHREGAVGKLHRFGRTLELQPREVLIARQHENDVAGGQRDDAHPLLAATLRTADFVRADVKG